MIPMINLGTEPVAVTRGMRIAQLVFQRVEQVELVEVEALPASERGGGGFGRTGPSAGLWRVCALSAGVLGCRGSQPNPSSRAYPLLDNSEVHQIPAPSVAWA